MTAFVLVAGPWTGDWIWRAVAARLREAGCQAYPAALTGMGGRRDEAGPDTDLETHIADLVRLIDEVDAERVVIVGHGLGIHPVRGAADRRPDRISRIVHLDAGIPRDGESVLGLLPDPEVRARLLRRAEDGWRIPAPTREEWPAWGSLAGVPDEALDQLVRLAVPQPLGTLGQRLRLGGAVASLPTTGVLCTANGGSIAVVETLVRMGDPQLRALIDPQVTFFELATGHWPMLSVPGELAATLLRAAAGEGHRLSPELAAERPAAARPFLLDVPRRPRERVGRVDLYLPDEPSGADAGPRPAVVFVHGGPVPVDHLPTPRDSDTFVGYGSYVAAQGAVGVTLDHRLHALGDYGRAADDV
ncbi:MAG TPA: alpha/beta hydrolase, partial [Streptomyces sp.]